ncbi:unnamed protein product [Schistocephalus solidus]|uniref:Serine/arginine repetitive matrix protein 2 n=1 Tax=Schistocephalus solidus TaxID=70667 RepID=A0A183SYD5_SCHSO|nr:unnamed protein product [Schistocephalus solidus]
MLTDRSYKSEQLRLNGNINHFSFNVSAVNESCYHILKNNLDNNQLHLHGYDEVFCVDAEEEVTTSTCRIWKEKQDDHTSLKTSPIAQRCFLPSALDFGGSTRFTFDGQRPFCLNRRALRSSKSPGEPPNSVPTPGSAPPSDNAHPAFPRQAAFSSSGSILGDLCGVPLFFMPSLSQVDPLTGPIEDRTNHAAPENNGTSSNSTPLPLSTSAKRKLSGAKNSKKSTSHSKQITNPTISAGDPSSEAQKICHGAANVVCTPAKNVSKTVRHRSKEKKHHPTNNADAASALSKSQEPADVRVSTELLKPDCISLAVSPEPELTVRSTTSNVGESASDGVGDDSGFTVVTNKKTKSRPKPDRCSTNPTFFPPPRGHRVLLRAPMVRRARSPPHQIYYATTAPSSQTPRRSGPPQPRTHQPTSAPSHQMQTSGHPRYHQRPARPAETSTFAQVVSHSMTEPEMPVTQFPKPTECSPRPEADSVRSRKTASADCSESASCTARSPVSSPPTPSSETGIFSERSLSETASPVPGKLSKQHLLLTDFMTSAWSNFSKSFQ